MRLYLSLYRPLSSNVSEHNAHDNCAAKLKSRIIIQYARALDFVFVGDFSFFEYSFFPRGATILTKFDCLFVFVRIANLFI